MRKLNNANNIAMTHSSDTSNTVSINKSTTNENDGILNTNNGGGGGDHRRNFINPINLLKHHKNRISYGLSNKLLKLRTFFESLLRKNDATNLDANNNLNNENPTKKLQQPHNAHKFYSIAFNLMQCEQALYENQNFSYCTCKKNKDDKLCIYCTKQNRSINLVNNGSSNCDEIDIEKFYFTSLNNNNNSNKTSSSPLPLANYSILKKSSDLDTSLPLDLLNSTTLLPSSITLMQNNSNYILYDIPEVDESDENDKDFIEYYYNRNI